MAVATPRYVSEEEFLELEEKALEKHEYYRGQIYAMAGGTPEHASISSNANFEITRMARERGCQTYSSDLRIRINATGLNTYPDVAVRCGPPKKTHHRPPAITNPSLVVEVLSDSTRDYDRGEKLRHYQTIESLTDYILIWQDRPRVEHYRREPGQAWSYSMIDGLDRAIPIETLGGVIGLCDIYRGVTFAEAPILRPPALEHDAPADD
jgi:Uma2 family endonuclease